MSLGLKQCSHDNLLLLVLQYSEIPSPSGHGIARCPSCYNLSAGADALQESTPVDCKLLHHGIHRTLWQHWL